MGFERAALVIPLNVQRRDLLSPLLPRPVFG
jgi:hypothetical protein